MAQVASLLAFCADLAARLPTSTDSAAIEALFDDVTIHLRAVKIFWQKRSQQQQLDVRGTQTLHELECEAISLWNLCTRLRREVSVNDAASTATNGAVGMRKSLLLRCRVFAFLLIDAARRSVGAEGEKKKKKRSEVVAVEDLTYLLRLALKAARSCIEGGGQELELALGCLQKAVDYIKEVKEGKCPREYEGEFRGMETEYFVLRTVLVGFRHLPLSLSLALISVLTFFHVSPGKKIDLTLPSTCTARQETP